jgi:hypothetical protein
VWVAVLPAIAPLSYRRGRYRQRMRNYGRHAHRPDDGPQLPAPLPDAPTQRFRTAGRVRWPDTDPMRRTDPLPAYLSEQDHKI